jgi:hypothetical protein
LPHISREIAKTDHHPRVVGYLLRDARRTNRATHRPVSLYSASNSTRDRDLILEASAELRHILAQPSNLPQHQPRKGFPQADHGTDSRRRLRTPRP